MKVNNICILRPPKRINCFHNYSKCIILILLYRAAKIKSDGIIVVDDPSKSHYPMPIHAEGKDEVFVGRIRRDESQPNSINLWIVSDNLRKGAATNAVQIAEYLLEEGLI